VAGLRKNYKKSPLKLRKSCDILKNNDDKQIGEELIIMKRIKTLTTKNLKDTMKKGGCGECQTSCQSACKTSCTVGNQSCENK
jgi:predicted ribosomally synthesized six-cysteine peptide SCIFF